MRQADLDILFIGPRMQEMIPSFFNNLVNHSRVGCIASGFPLPRK